MTEDISKIADGLSEKRKRSIIQAEPWGDRWWIPYSPGEEELEELHIFRFTTAQFTDLGLAVRNHLTKDRG